MDALDVLQHRRSTKSYLPKQINDEELEIILSAGLNAPSAMNMQVPKIVVVQDKAKLAELGKLNSLPMGGKTDPFYGAPTVCFIVVPDDAHCGVKDGSLVIGNMVNAAFSIGVGSSWIDRCDEMFATAEGKDILKSWGLDGYNGVGCCILGYQDKALPAKEIKAGRIVRIK